MGRNNRAIIALLALLALWPAAVRAQPAPAVASAADQRLRALTTRVWAEMQRDAAALPGTGPGALMDHWARVDPASQAARRMRDEAALRELAAIPAAQLSDESQVDAAVFRTMLEEEAADIRFRAYEAPFTSDSFFWAEVAPQSGFDTADEYRRYIARIRDLPRYFGEQTANMRAGLARGFSIPRVTLTGRERTMEPYLVDGDRNPLATPFAHMPAAIPASDQARLRADGLAAIRDAGAPAFRTLHTMFLDEYLPRARSTLSAGALPDGAAYYQAMLRKYTTLELTPREIHDLGLREVARIRAEMEAVMRRADFRGDVPAFIRFLRTDPRFYPRTGHEVLAEAAYVVKRVDARLADFFATLPRFRHGIVPVPDDIAPVYTSARGGLRNCLFNTYNLPARPMYQLPALALHECTPGHSFQAALALEGPDRPEFRQQTYFSGYGEGWGLYVEGLGAEMGIYETPYQDFGRLSYEMWRAARLVIDTGIHAFGWTREQAQQYLRDNTALSELELVNEVDRYISWPGQAPSYMLGALTIRRLRAEAQLALGARFDIRAFHTLVLGLGSVPLTVLEARVRAWVAAQRQAGSGR